MGSNQSNQSSQKHTLQQKYTKRQGQMMQNISCIDDLQCQNINSKMSVPGQPPVLVCPSAKCVGGTCDCGSDCKKDPYMGFCCKDVETIKSFDSSGHEDVNTFCIENFSNSTISGVSGVESKELFGPF